MQVSGFIDSDDKFFRGQNDLLLFWLVYERFISHTVTYDIYIKSERKERERRGEERGGEEKGGKERSTSCPALPLWVLASPSAHTRNHCWLQQGWLVSAKEAGTEYWVWLTYQLNLVIQLHYITKMWQSHKSKYFPACLFWWKCNYLWFSKSLTWNILTMTCTFLVLGRVQGLGGTQMYSAKKYLTLRCLLPSLILKSLDYLSQARF